jgi:hypothetical protein
MILTLSGAFVAGVVLAVGRSRESWLARVR